MSELEDAQNTQMRVEIPRLEATIVRLTAERDRLRKAVKCLQAVCDTPIARRRLRIDGDDERLAFARAALKETRDESV